MTELKQNLTTESLWEIREEVFDAEQLVTAGSNYMTGNGYMGYRGTLPDWGKAQYVGCVVTDTYDNADGKWKELCTVPNPLYTAASWEGRSLGLLNIPDQAVESYQRELDFRYGIHSFSYTVRTEDGAGITVSHERYASYENIHNLYEKWSLVSDKPGEVTVKTGIDGDIWSLNGNHFSRQGARVKEGVRVTESVTGEQGIRICTAAGSQWDTAPDETVEEQIEPRFNGKTVRFHLKAGQTITLTRMASIYTSQDGPEPESEAVQAVTAAEGRGWEALARVHREIWDRYWQDTDVIIQGDKAAQALLRYNIYQNRIAVPSHTDHLPIGARGLSCQAYQGAAFWDEEIFNLPMFLYTRPEIARRILTYRYKTLDGARRKAKQLGYEGAFYAWISGETGDELCPSFFFRDVLTGRRIHNHFNDWQMHISPDITYALWLYWEVTQDWDFLRDMGAEMAFEICRFIFSYGYYNPSRDRYEMIRLLGPDEYHENVDNDFFTNFQCQFALRRGVWIYRKLEKEDPDCLQALARKVGLKARDAADWEQMAEKLYVPQPHPESALIEQFDGYFQLEDILPDQLKERLQDPGEYWGWPNGIAVETQVLKQADVIQLFALHDEAYPEGIMRANYEYYEPRTQHGSSLSLSVYSLIAARIGRIDEAYRYFMRSCTVDLFNTNKAVSGGTFIGGIHTAACGIAWQMAVKGFAGFDMEEHGISFRPALPKGWTRMEFPLYIRGCRLRAEITEDRVSVSSEAGNHDISVSVAGRALSLSPGSSVEFTLDRKN